MPGDYPIPGYENPYRASSLDPRVDGGKARPRGEAKKSTSQDQPRTQLAGSSRAGDAGTGRGAAEPPEALSSSSEPLQGPVKPPVERPAVQRQP